MAVIGMLLAIAGLIVAIGGYIWFLIVAFQENILWGVGSLLLPIVGLVFLVLHFDRAGKPFLIQLAGGALAFVGGMLGGTAG